MLKISLVSKDEATGRPRWGSESTQGTWSPLSGSPRSPTAADDLEQPVPQFPTVCGLTEKTSVSAVRSLAFPLLALLVGAIAGAATMAYLGQRMPTQGTYEIAPPARAVPPAYMASRPLNNSCLLNNLQIPEGPRTFDACKFVIESTDLVWNLRGDVDAAIEKYFHEGYYNAGSWGRRGIGKAELKDAVHTEMRAFPDIQIHITDCSCIGNDIDGYKCMMPDVLEGTNSGPSAYGPATNRYARWTGLIESFVKRDTQTGQWQYVAEWGVHDEWALIQQLGLDFTRVPHPTSNSEPIHDCEPLLRLGQVPAMSAADAAIQAAHV